MKKNVLFNLIFIFFCLNFSFSDIVREQYDVSLPIGSNFFGPVYPEMTRPNKFQEWQYYKFWHENKWINVRVKLAKLLKNQYISYFYIGQTTVVDNENIYFDGISIIKKRNDETGVKTNDQFQIIKQYEINLPGGTDMNGFYQEHEIIKRCGPSWYFCAYWSNGIKKTVFVSPASIVYDTKNNVYLNINQQQIYYKENE